MGLGIDWPAHLIYALAWASFGAGHSLLAGTMAKESLSRWLGRGYRLAYNLFSAVHIAAVVGIGWWQLGAAPAFALPPGVATGLLVGHVVGWAALLVLLRGYDLGRFAGLRQLREGGAAEDEEPLITTGAHAYVRHPLYAAAFVVLWTAATTPLGLATAVWASLYLWIGSRCEERRLAARFGDVYRRYARRVPAFVPWKGRAAP